MEPINNVKIKVKDLNFYYGLEQQALNDINVDFYDKKVTALIGPSGCGKSTLLRTLNLIYKIYPGQKKTGTILLDDRDIEDKDIGELRREVGMVFQKPTPFPMSIFDNVAYGLKLHERLSSQALNERVQLALEQAGLWKEVHDQLNKSGLSLSGGQQQRLCIARTIALKPKVVLFDEPTSALDPISAAHIESTILELKKDFTIIIVTHNMQQAKRISDYALYMYLGKIIEFDQTSVIFSDQAKEQATRDYVAGKFG
jgi:phosphate transport system ATP-binding protein